jgi:hypothetical protein
MILSNEQMEDRAREGLRGWFCRMRHRPHHSVLSVRDGSWNVMDHHFSCSKCKHFWTVSRPRDRAMSRALGESVIPVIWDTLMSRDPVYEMLLKEKP